MEVPRTPAPPHVRVAVVGTGFGGLGAAAALLRDGVTSLVVFERAQGVGGVWRANRYPGAACDIQSHLYEFADAPNPDWSRRFATQPEICAYLERVAREAGVLPYVRFGHDVMDARWNDAAARWHIATSGGCWTADVLVAAPGALAAPSVPDVPGLGTFAGTVVHTSRWPAGLDVAGRRVAVVGTGASAVQVVPALQRAARHVTVFQRTAPHVMPRLDRRLGPLTRSVLRVPAAHRALRAALYGLRETYGRAMRVRPLAAVGTAVARLHLVRQVPDAALRRRLTPGYRFGCKRVLLSDDYYPALGQPNATLAGAAAAVRPHGVVDAEGVEHAADVLVFATGFHVHDLPFARRVRGRAGRTLADVWGPSPTAHLGTTVAGFPNLFVLQGPNTSLGHTSVVLTIEAQVAHVVAALRAMLARGLAAVEPRASAQAAFAADVDRLGRASVWTTGGCASWYLDATGRNAALWPASVAAFRRRVAPFRAAEYHLRPVEPVVPVVRPRRARRQASTASAGARSAASASV